MLTRAWRKKHTRNRVILGEDRDAAAVLAPRDRDDARQHARELLERSRGEKQAESDEHSARDDRHGARVAFQPAQQRRETLEEDRK